MALMRAQESSATSLASKASGDATCPEVEWKKKRLSDQALKRLDTAMCASKPWDLLSPSGRNEAHGQCACRAGQTVLLSRLHADAAARPAAHALQALAQASGTVQEAVSRLRIS